MCRDCGQQFTRKCNLTIYINSIHKGKKFKCDHVKKSLLVKETEDKRYACTMCDYQTTYQSSVKIHTEAIHEGLRYSCDICGCKSSSKSNLIMHIKTKHEETSLKAYSCNAFTRDYRETRERWSSPQTRARKS